MTASPALPFFPMESAAQQNRTTFYPLFFPSTINLKGGPHV
ncbi:MAG: hypothetical protein ANABAC_1531 [Anaerolineae bacterium]|nr:MAG: hypothetical protein ANABAC_1531 [Anaerolineae bacterium]